MLAERMATSMYRKLRAASVVGMCRVPRAAPMVHQGHPCRSPTGPPRRLTVKLRGRTTTPDKRRGRTLSPDARDAKQEAHHGPLQRLLGADILLDLPDYVTAGHKSPGSTIVTVIAVVAHHEERLSWHENS